MDKFIDDQIRRAIEAGEFDDLPGKGKPIDLKAYFETPEDLRMAYSILKSNNFVPEEVEILKEIEALKKRLEACSDEEQQSRQKGNHRQDLHLQHAHRKAQPLSPGQVRSRCEESRQAPL